jgi:hypothetical protein
VRASEVVRSPAFVSAFGLAVPGGREVASVVAVSRATPNMRPRHMDVKSLNHNILRFYFRSDARYREH